MKTTLSKTDKDEKYCNTTFDIISRQLREIGKPPEAHVTKSDGQREAIPLSPGLFLIKEVIVSLTVCHSDSETAPALILQRVFDNSGKFFACANAMILPTISCESLLRLKSIYSSSDGKCWKHRKEKNSSSIKMHFDVIKQCVFSPNLILVFVGYFRGKTFSENLNINRSSGGESQGCRGACRFAYLPWEC